MSFLSILLVASAFYFAHARPDSQPLSEASGGAQANDERVEHAPAVPLEHPEPFTDPTDDQHKLFGFMKAIEKAVDEHMTPLMSKLDVKKQDELKSMAMNGMASYSNYMALLITDFVNEKVTGHNIHGDSLPTRDEMILQFKIDDPLDPNIPLIAVPEDEDEE